MTHYTHADLEMADRHIAEGGQHIARQEQIVASLQLKGLSTSASEKMLTLFNETQAAHRKHREAIAYALEQAEIPPAFSLRGER